MSGGDALPGRPRYIDRTSVRQLPLRRYEDRAGRIVRMALVDETCLVDTGVGSPVLCCGPIYVALGSTGNPYLVPREYVGPGREFRDVGPVRSLAWSVAAITIVYIVLAAVSILALAIWRS